MNEVEDNPFLTEAEINDLSKYPHTLEYKFTGDQLEFLDKNGYLVIEKLIPEELCDELINEGFSFIKEHYNIDPQDSKNVEVLRKNRGFIDLWHSNGYYKIRQLPQLYSIFSQLLRERKLTVSLDRANFKPPHDVETNNTELSIHTDLNPWVLFPTKYQGGIALSDSDETSGGFCCIPGYHKLDKIIEYRKNYENGKFHHGVDKVSPPPKNQTFVYYMDLEATKKSIQVPMKKGDFVIWNSRLPHGNSKNFSDKWRIQCYVRFVQRNLYKDYTEEVRRCAESGKVPKIFSTENETNASTEFNVKNYKMPEITSLGRKILGFEEW